MYIKNEIVAKLESLGVSPKKSLGQNFLVSRVVIDRIIKSVSSFTPKALIEIGPGLGSLTEDLLKLEIPLELMELDRTFAKYWREDRSVRVIEGDALKWDWKRFSNNEDTLLVSNLPYQISSSIVIDRSIQQPQFKGMVLMFQKEVAERILAKSKTSAYGLLSVMAQSFWKIEIVTDAGPNDFFPSPNVGSRVLSFTSKESQITHPKEFLSLVKAGFAQRRKYLLTNLKALNHVGGAAGLAEAFAKLEFSTQMRAEELTIDDWARLYNQLKK